MSPSAKGEMLKRIRRALGDQRGPKQSEYGSIERAYQVQGGLDHAARVNLFADRLREYGAGVFRCRAGEIAEFVGECLKRRALNVIVVPPGLDARWLPAGFQFLVDESLAPGQLDTSQGALTGCALGIAETGSLVLHEPALHGRRALTLVPDYHLCVIGEMEIVETVPEGFRTLAANGVRSATIISGPSATSDIEMTRIQGVHGPRKLDVIVFTSDDVST